MCSMAGKEGTGSQKLLHSRKKKIEVTNPVVLKGTLKIKTKVAFWIKYFIGLIKLYHLSRKCVVWMGTILSSECSI